MSQVDLPAPYAGQNFTPPTAIDIATLEAALVAQLKSQINVVEIVAFRGDPETYRMTHRIGAALVRFKHSQFADPDDTYYVAQERKMIRWPP